MNYVFQNFNVFIVFLIPSQTSSVALTVPDQDWVYIRCLATGQLLSLVNWEEFKAKLQLYVSQNFLTPYVTIKTKAE
jgi:hypothetical protein